MISYFQVVTSNSMLNTGDTSTCLDVMTSPVDFSRSVMLSEQQHVLLSGMLLPGGTANQAIHINVTQDTNSCVDVNAISQHEQVCKLVKFISTRIWPNKIRVIVFKFLKTILRIRIFLSYLKIRLKTEFFLA